MKILVVVFAVVILFAQADYDWNDWEKDEAESEWEKSGDAKSEWEKPDEAESEVYDGPENNGDDHTSDTDDWYDKMYGSGSFNTIFLPLVVASFVVARLARR